MSPLAALRRFPGLRPAPQPEVPDLIPEGWLLLETRWDCSYCHGVQPAVVGVNSFRCLRCNNEIDALTD